MSSYVRLEGQKENVMSELRAPDPTLDALGDSAVIRVEPLDSLPVIHADIGCPEIDQRDTEFEDARYARWFAVPCRKCFPDAPPPGMKPTRSVVESRYYVPDPNLAWQTNG